MKKTNVVFVDGHGGPMGLEDMGYRLDSEGKFLIGTEGKGNDPTNGLFSGSSQDLPPPPRNP